MFGGRGNWTGREELLLLEAVEYYGFGNWELISRYVESRIPEGLLLAVQISSCGFFS